MIMSYKRIITILIAATVAGTGCKKLDFIPAGIVSPTEAYKTEADVRDLVNGMYLPVAGGNFYGGRLQRVSELMSDFTDGSAISGYDADIYNFRSSADAGSGDVYRDAYNAIMRANTALENLGLVTSSTATRDNYEGQARFIRAISHFETVKLHAQPFGFTADNGHLGIVIKTKSEFEGTRSRNTVKEVYDAILADLSAAQNLLPASNGVYPTRWAAKGYLARVYFQMNRMDSAYKYANEVIAGSTATFDASATFATKRFNKPVTSEAIFYLVNETGQGPRFGGLRNDGNIDQSLGLPITFAAYTAGTSNTNDVRKIWYTNVSGAYGISKYRIADFVMPVLHITELKLIRAEAAATLNQNLSVAIGDINDITNRAYAGTKPPLAGSSTASLVLSTVRAERKLEMIYESGDRLQQIKRIGAKGEPSVSRANAPWNCNGMVLQFPAQEFNVNVNFLPNPTGGCL
jgi:starch-binding outer membrane protein, SusD/RagB family